MKAQDLKNSILQLAIQGKLVEQRKEEGTAKELIEQIKVEKEKLIKEGKIKKTKPLPEITEDEKPFDIPESWEWVRLGDLGIAQTGTTPSKTKMEYFGDFIPFISPGDILNGVINYCNQGLSEKGREVGRVSEKNSILQVCIGGSIGKCAINSVDVSYNQQINAITPLICNHLYLYYLMDSKFFLFAMTHKATGTATPIINKSSWESLVVPLPPLAEQKRIVAKIEELLPYVEKYDKAYTEVEELNKKFPEDMQKSILQYAIQGKLVEQREEDGTAEELYQQIQAEKEKLIKEGKIKKTKPLPEITEDEIPFDIPENWKWVRLEQVCEYIQRGKSPKYSEFKKYPVVAQKCNQWSGFSLEKAKFIDPKTIESYTQDRILQDGDLMWNSTGLGTLGRVAIYEDSKNPYELAVADSHVTVIRALKQYVDFKYIYYYIANPSVQSVIEKQSSGSTKQIELATNTVKNYICPLPPLEEQKRIVEKIEELLPYTKQLVKKID